MCAEQVTPAVMPAYRGYNPWAYPGLVSCMDTTADITGSYPMGPAGGFGPSVFGGGFGMPFGMGMPGMMGGMMPGMMGGPWSELMNMNAEQSMDYTSRIRSKQLNHGVELSRQTQNAEHQASIHNKIVAEKAAVLKDMIQQNNQDQIPAAYETLKEVVKAKLVYEAGPNAEPPTEHDIDAAAKTLYAQAMKDGNIQDHLRKYGDSSFMSGFKKNFGLIGRFFMESKTATQNIAEIDGTQVPKSEQAQEYAGGAVALVLTALGALLLHKGYKWAKAPHVVKVGTGVAGALNHDAELAKLRPLADKYKKAAMKEIDVEDVDYFHMLHKDGDLLKEDGAGKACKAYQEILNKIETLEVAKDAAELKKAGIKI